MSLKTLKDIDKKLLEEAKERKDEYEIIRIQRHSKKIKAEAVKWVKDMRNMTGLCITADQAFKRFFNITEEDLK